MSEHHEADCSKQRLENTRRTVEQLGYRDAVARTLRDWWPRRHDDVYSRVGVWNLIRTLRLIDREERS